MNCIQKYQIPERDEIIKIWNDNLMLYKYNPNASNANMLQDYLPSYRFLIEINTRILSYSIFKKNQQDYQEFPFLRSLQQYGIKSLKKLQKEELIRLNAQNNNIIRLIIKGIVTNIDLIEFINTFPDVSRILLSQRATEEQQFLPQELAVLFKYSYQHCEKCQSQTSDVKDPVCYFSKLWDLYVQYGVENTIKKDILLKFAIESGEFCVLTYILQKQEFQDLFFGQSMHTYSVINTDSFIHILNFFKVQNKLDLFLDKYDQQGLLPIHAAAIIGNIKVLRIIFDNSFVLSKLTKQGMSILQCVFTSRNALCQKFVIDTLIQNQLLAQLSSLQSTEYCYNIFHFAIITEDVQGLSLLLKYVDKSQLRQKSSVSNNYTPVELASLQEDDVYLQQLVPFLSAVELQQLQNQLSQIDSETIVSNVQFTKPETTSILVAKRNKNIIIRKKSQILTSSYFIVFILSILVPIFILENKNVKSILFILSEIILSGVLVYNIFIFIGLNLILLPQRQNISITQLSMAQFDSISYCAPGDQIMMQTDVFHCDSCQKCQPQGSYHSRLLGKCIYPKQRWMFISLLISSILAFLLQLYVVGQQNYQSKGKLIIQLITSGILVVIITVLTMISSSFIFFIHKIETKSNLIRNQKVAMQ